MNTPKQVFEFTGLVTSKEKDKEPVVYRETFFAGAETVELALRRLTEANPKVAELTYTGKSKACSQYW